MQPVNQFGSGHGSRNGQTIWLTAKPLALAFFAHVVCRCNPAGAFKRHRQGCKASPGATACRVLRHPGSLRKRFSAHPQQTQSRLAESIKKSFHAACACLALISPLRTLMDKALENSVIIQSDDTRGSVQDSNQASIAGLAGSGTNNGTAALVSR
ncbi:MAG: hypothetical protein IPL72_07685 [Sulfuritalea sp.]|nr:hypothetical protein [Sulfuritalea sp.]